MSTARDLIKGSLRLLGVVATGESVSADEQADAFSALNDMIDSWSNENLLIPNKVREVFSLAPAQSAYTMGDHGDFDTVRAMKIENALYQRTGSTPIFELPVRVVSKDEFAAIKVKSLSSSIPQYLYAEGTYPLDTINIWPIPSEANHLVLYSWKPLSKLSTVDDSIDLPPGYLRALRYNLAVEISPEYGKPIDPVVAGIATESKELIKRMNVKPHYMVSDAMMLSNRKFFNWLTGD